MMRAVKLIGQKYGRLLVVEKTDKRLSGKVIWKCKCACGKETLVTGDNLRSGHTTSCGCYKKDKEKQKASEIIGQRFGRLTVVEMVEKRSNRGDILLLCRCDCGKEKLNRRDRLLSGDTTSCGCYHDEATTRRFTIHNHATRRNGMTREYRTWHDMLQRCNNEDIPNFKDYGGRGIRVCDEWMNFENFLAYLKSNNMYPKPAGLSIDRIDNDGNYEPGNIRWATARQQRVNQRKRAA